MFDSDHVADPAFLEATLGWMEDPAIAFVQTPQYYANTDTSRIAAASWAQQALFFGAIARGKDGLNAVFCCGTNVLFRRAAFESVGGFPTNSLTEDFELSIHLHEKGWSSAYLPDVLARGLGPEDTAAYVSQQQRWARGCLSGIPRALRAKLPLRLKAQYLLSGVYFLSGWTALIYMSFPVIRLLGGGQPIGGITAPEFLLHFTPYYVVALSMAALAGAGSYTFSAFALAAANFWIHVLSTIYTVLRKSGSFVVTPKKGAEARQPRGGDARARDGGDPGSGERLRPDQTSQRVDDQQRLLRRPAHLDPADRLLGRARETRGRGARAGGGRRLTRALFAAVLAALALAVAALRQRDQGRREQLDRAVAGSHRGIAAQRFLRRYVMPDGRVSRIDQGGDTVGEGQAYGMLMAAAIGDESAST